jgi:hypothetical protein
MAYEDLEAALAHYQAIRSEIIHHPGGWRDEILLRKLDLACEAAVLAVDDRECKVHIGAVEDYCRQLYSTAAHLEWARGQTSGADHLRLRILRELEAFRARVLEIETLRDASAGVPPADVDRLQE